MTEIRNLEEIRSDIDELDQQLLTLFCKRMELAADVAAYKRANGLPTLRPEREQEILRWAETSAAPGYGAYARRLFEGIMEISRDYQDSLRNQEASE